MKVRYCWRRNTIKGELRMLVVQAIYRRPNFTSYSIMIYFKFSLRTTATLRKKVRSHFAQQIVVSHKLPNDKLFKFNLLVIDWTIWSITRCSSCPQRKQVFVATTRNISCTHSLTVARRVTASFALISANKFGFR